MLLMFYDWSENLSSGEKKKEKKKENLRCEVMRETRLEQFRSLYFRRISFIEETSCFKSYFTS